VLRCATAEGDDIIARWINLHPQDDHIVISSDTDFVQLVAPNVKQYNGITDELITVDGIFDAKGRPVVDKKTKEPKKIPDPAWLLFEKCMRGDTSDNVFSAYPGVRTKGSKNKVGLEEAFADRTNKGYNWNNLMLQRWTDHNGEEHRVLDDYERNRQLIDLAHQPQAIKDTVDLAIIEQVSHKDIGQVGVRFMQFCGKYDLVRCSESADSFGRWMNETYKGVLNVSG
jgi:5'-3' exonuclease